MVSEDRNKRSLLYKTIGSLMPIACLGVFIAWATSPWTTSFALGMVMTATIVCPITFILAIVFFVLADRARRK